MLKKFSVVGGWCGRVIIVSALSLRDQDRDKEKERARYRAWQFEKPLAWLYWYTGYAKATTSPKMITENMIRVAKNVVLLSSSKLYPEG